MQVGMYFLWKPIILPVVPVWGCRRCKPAWFPLLDGCCVQMVQIAATASAPAKAQLLAVRQSRKRRGKAVGCMVCGSKR